MDKLTFEERKDVEMSPFEKKVKAKGDIGQADRLLQQKRLHAAK